MIKIYLLDFSGADSGEKSLSALPEYIEKTKNPKLRRERIFSYMLLSLASREWLDTPIEEIKRDENGRPFFPGAEIDFNLSHDEGMAALVISDEGRVGIDVQSKAASVSEKLIKKYEEIFERYNLSSMESRLSAFKITIFSLSDKGIKKSDVSLSDIQEPLDFYDKWTQLEAISKADGRGLSALFGADFSNEKFLIGQACVDDKCGNTYSLCVSKRC